MDYEMRPITGDEWLEFNRAAANGFGSHGDDTASEEQRGILDLDRSLATFDNGHIVSTAGIFSFQLTVPGPQVVPAGGVTWITVLPTHRRRGILTAVMRRQLSDMRERGEPLGMLWASESIIYGRFGYGAATVKAKYEINVRHAHFARAPHITGRVRMIDAERALELFPDIYDQTWRARPGEVARGPAHWKNWMRDPERWRDGASARFYVVHESDDGDFDGYATYRIKHNWQNGIAANELRLTSLVTLNASARASLWRYLLDVDLIGTVESYNLPPDEPLPWMLADPRRFRTTAVTDGIWVRVIDIPAALSGRCYAAEGRLVLDVTDPFCPENDGRYLLEGGPHGATCKTTTRKPDLSLQLADLGAVYLGGVSFSVLAQAGRVEGHTAGALACADALFHSPVVPYCDTDF